VRFEDINTIAVVGISDNPERDSYRVARYLQQAGFRVIPVNPTLTEVLGERCYPSLRDIPPDIKVDVVDIFRKPEHVPPVVEQAIERKVPVVWMQLGVHHPQAAAMAEEAGLEVVMDRCIKVEHGAWKEGLR